jgi:hypothetical protein
MRIFLSLIFVSFSFLSFSQQLESRIKKNTYYAEFLGQGIIGSLNYDRLFDSQGIVKKSFSIGGVYASNIRNFEFLNTYPYPKTYNFGIPISYNFLIGNKNNHLEIGIGLSTFYFHGNVYIQQGFCGTHFPSEYNAKVKNFNFYLNPKISYRYQKANGGLFFKATFSPSFNLLNVKNINELDYDRKSIKVGFFDKYQNLILWPGISLGYTF